MPAPGSAAEEVVPPSDAEVDLEELPPLARRCRGPPTNPPNWPQELRRAELNWAGLDGRLCWDAAEQTPAPHVRRWSGVMPVMALNAGRKVDIQKWASCGAPLGLRTTTANDALETLTEWLSARPHIQKSVYNVSLENPPGINFGVGWWVRLSLAGHRRSDAFEVAAGMRRSYHGTALASLGRIIEQGICTGFASNSDSGRILRGIWSLAPERSPLLLSYMLYSGLDRSGWLFSPVVELRSPNPDPQGRPVVMKRSTRGSGSNRNRDQWLSYDDTTSQVAIWIHALHVSEVATADDTSGLSIFAEGRMPADFELHPLAPWERIVANSAPPAQDA